MKDNLSTMAKRLGVSVSTVSRVMSGNAAKHRIPQATAQRIIEEAERCHYVPGPVVRKSSTIGLVLPSMANPFFADMASVVISEANLRGCTTVLVDTMEDEDNQRDAVMSILFHNVQGMIVAPCGGEQLLSDIRAGGTPVVLIDRYFAGGQLPYVTTNNYKGGSMATLSLIEHGHSRIACIQGVESSMPNRERVRGYLDEMRLAGLESCSKVVGREFSIQNGYLETRMLLSEPNPPSAIFALSNTIGLGAMKAIRELGLRIPEDISLISYDNNIYLDYMIPPITRISQPVGDMARLATKMLFENTDASIMLSPSLISGASVRPMRYETKK